MALQTGLKKGGAAKGELVLAIFELANCFRHGWGIPKDAIAAKQVGCITMHPGTRANAVLSTTRPQQTSATQVSGSRMVAHVLRLAKGSKC